MYRKNYVRSDMNKFKINENWTFADLAVNDAKQVNIPHTVKIEDLDVYKPYMGTFNYVRDMSDVIANRGENRVFIEFEGVMTNCKIFYNEVLLTEHFGGYLPIYIDITDSIGVVNIMRVQVENYDDTKTPPGKETGGLDFLYYGGIYRDVNVYYKPNIYITNALENIDVEGGVKLTATKDGDTYSLASDVVIANKLNESVEGVLQVEVLDGVRVIATTKINCKLVKKKVQKFKIDIKDINIIEWCMSDPKLYSIRVSVCGYDEIIEYGFRTLEISKEGFKLNGEVVEMFGFNRHQQYPYIGIACSSEAERREARMLKTSGVNTLRLAHYPQSSAFLSECSRIGLMVIDCVPGWQFRGGKVWQNRLIQCVKDMVRRDRNVASVVIFEVTPNETHWANRRGDRFYRALHLAAKGEMENCITSGDTEGRLNAEKIEFDVPYSGADKLSKRRELYKNGEKKFLKREYGDWGFGGNKSTSRVDIDSGDLALRQQAFNFQWDRNNTYKNENVLGDLVWEGVDHNRGYYHKAPISKSGIFNIFRLPKYSYYWVKSQTFTNEYTLFPAISECDGSKKFIVYSNCSSISIIDDGKEIARRTPDNGEYHYFDRSQKTVIPDNYWALGENHVTVSNRKSALAVFANHHLYDGGDCQNLKYPPYTFTDITFSGKLVKFIGYDDAAVEVASYVKTPLAQATKLKIELVSRGIDLIANDNDWIWLYVYAVDDNGQVDHKFDGEIIVDVLGGSVIHSNKIKSQVGIAAFMMKATESVVNISACSGGLNAAASIVTVAK